MTHRRYAITLSGVPVAFAEQGFPTSELSAWDSIAYGLHDIGEGESVLDLSARRQMGSGFSFRMRDSGNVVRDLVKVRQDPVGWLVESELPANNTAISFVEVSDPADIPSPFYLGFETLSYNGTSGSDIANVSRALYDSDPQRHFGAANDGAAGAIYDAPPKWTGRRVTLWRSTRKADGTMGTKEAVETASMEDVPRYLGSDTWVFDAASLAQWYAGRRIFQGLQPVVPPDDDDEFAETVNVDENTAKRLWDGINHPAANVLWTFEDGSQWMGPIASSTTTTVTIDTGGPIGGRVLNRPGRRWAEAMPLIAWQGDPVDVVLSFLGSRLGDGTLGTWDVLPGREAESFDGVEFFAGAQIDNSDLDVEAFEQFRGAGPGWTVVLDEQMEVQELLREFCQAVGAFWYVDTTGRLSVSRLQERVPPSASALEITDAIWHIDAPDAVVATEQTVFHTVRFRGNWDPVAREHRARVDVVDAPSRRESPFDDRALELESRFVHVDVKQWGAAPTSSWVSPNPIHRLDLETQLRRVQQYSKRPATEVVTTVPATTSTDAAVPGAIVTVTNGRCPDLAGDYLTSAVGQVIGRRPDRELDTYQLRVRILDNGFLFAPSAEITTVSPAGGSLYIVLLDGTAPWNFDSTPSEEFAEGWTVEDTQQGWEATVDTVGVGGLILDMNSGVPVVGDIVVPVAGSTGDDNAQGFDPTDFTYTVNDTGTSGVKTRWS